MATYNLSINGKVHKVNVDADTPLLWVLRDHSDLIGTKFGCGVAQCGACTVHLNGMAVRSCSLPVLAIGNQKITSIKGLSATGDQVDVSQCGYSKQEIIPTLKELGVGFIPFSPLVKGFLTHDELVEIQGTTAQLTSTGAQYGASSQQAINR